MTPTVFMRSSSRIRLLPGADPKVVQRILGHASAAMPMDLYGHLIDQNLWDAAARIGGTMGAPEASRLGSGHDRLDQPGL